MQNNSHAYDIYVRALSTDMEVSDTGFAERLIAMDTPVTQADGQSPENGPGVAEITWDAVDDPSILGSDYSGGQYHFRWRRLTGDHANQYWKPVNYENDISTGYLDLNGKTYYELEQISLNVIYAIQLKYDVNIDGILNRVYSARDVYVWPAPPEDDRSRNAKRFPENRVATYPFFGHWSDRSVEFQVCKNTFLPSGDRSDWVQLVEHAAENWQVESANLITMHPTVVDDCKFPMDLTTGIIIAALPDILLGGNISEKMVMSTRNEVNEVYMVDTTEGLTGDLSGLLVIANPIFACVYFAPACVISHDYYNMDNEAKSELDRNVSFFNRFRTPRSSADMLVSRTRLGSRPMSSNSPGNIPGVDDTTYTRSDVPFNTCLRGDGSRYDETNTDSGFFWPYHTIVHEFGHMLGMSGFRWPQSAIPAFDYPEAQPTIPDSLMNYDNEAPLLNSGDVTNHEPDCSPHPFDLMALHVLYQTVNR